MTSLGEWTALLGPQSFNFGWLEQWLVGNEAIARLIIACLLGGSIGLEREFKRHAAGVRTNMLICMACALFTLLSAVLAGDSGTNRGQVASNIVQGVGFLGAGLILHNRSKVSGMTSAASIFVVAAIGMACGAGLFAAATAATIIVLVALAVVGMLEQRVNLKSYSLVYEVRGSDAGTILTSILDAMDKTGERLKNVERDTIGAIERASFSLTATRRQHDLLKQQLRSEAAIGTVKVFHDPEED
jgi:putative Mg2+ transporter-C (MgtC) family protein